MPFAQPLDHLPLWALSLLTLAGVLLATEVGFRLGRHRNRRPEHEKESLMGAAVAATLGLVGFMLAFTFSVAGSRFDARRQAVLDEANAIGTTYLRAGILPDGRGDKIRRLLREYVDSRLEAVRKGEIEKGLRRSGELHHQLWAEAEAVATKHPESIQAGLFVQSLNETIDLHTTRVVAGLYNRIPLLVWLVLYGLTGLAMIGVGYHAGLSSNTRSLAFPMLAITLSAVLFIVADLDRPHEGMLRVGQQVLVDLRATMDQPNP
jgi:F0F1-type ATP synthase membrane subunit c/vacuolar-type H+-ATPase subunit K